MRSHKVLVALAQVEKGVAALSLAMLVVLPLASTLMRVLFRASIPDSSLLMRHLVLPVAFLGASLASRNHEHLGIQLGLASRKDAWGGLSRSLTAFFSGMFALLFFLASLASVLIFPEFTGFAWFVPLAPLLLVIPLGFLLVGVRSRPRGDALALGAFVAGLAAGLFWGLADLRDIMGALGADTMAWAAFDIWWGDVVQALRGWILVPLIVSAFFGTPLFVVLGGAAALLYAGPGYTLFGESMGAAPVIGSGYALITQDMVPAIALFTLTGFFLSESRTGERFVALFRALFGWIPGGVVAVVVLVSAFFTTFTGASGVTVLALGGLLHTILTEGKGGGEKATEADDRLAVGLVTSAGSAGLLFPPSLAIIMYGSIAMIPIDGLFGAALVPGLVMLAAMIGAGIFLNQGQGGRTRPFKARAALGALRDSLPELAIPVLVAALFMTGSATVGETAAWAAAYAFVVEVLIRREIRWAGLKHLLTRTLVIVGGVLIILGVARGLSSWLVENGIADLLSGWFATHIGSPWLFLLILNLLLLVVGCFMDLFSAVLVVVPIMIPVAAVYGIDPYHLAVIFLANLGVGFITPPVGMNLFLASYRFQRPLVKVYGDVWPFLVVQLLVVLGITYVPLMLG